MRRPLATIRARKGGFCFLEIVVHRESEDAWTGTLREKDDVLTWPKFAWERVPAEVLRPRKKTDCQA